jgi:mono/diheme cytochrome c family protein
VKLRIVLLAATAFGLAACDPSSGPAPAAPAPAAPIAETPAGPSGPAAENTTDSLASNPAPADAPAAAPAPAAPAAGGGLKVTDSPTLDQLASGRATFAATCAMCHGPTGQGTQMGVALTNGLEVAVIKEKITRGMINPGDKMPPMGPGLSDEQLESVAKFVAAGLPQ